MANRISAGIGLISCLALIGCAAPNPIPAATARPSPIPVGYSGSPVTANNQWTPVIQQFDGVDMVLVPAGCFMMGSTTEDFQTIATMLSQDFTWIRDLSYNETPAHEICFNDPLWIDRLEVSNAQFRQFDGVAEHESTWANDTRPREYISQKEASDFCQKRGARLPTEAEWEYAARGPDGLYFPWGNEFVADFAIYNQNSGNRTWDVGERIKGTSWVGALDMAGNVSEWTSSAPDDYPYDENHEQGVEDGLYTGAGGIIRGGGWFDDDYMIRTADREQLFIPELADQVGFRCARSTTDPQADIASAAVTPTTSATQKPAFDPDVLLDASALPTPYIGPLSDGAVARLGLGTLLVSSVSPGGQYLALATSSVVLVYRTDTLEVVWSFRRGSTTALAWTPDDSKLAASSWGAITAWDINEGSQIFSVTGNDRYFSALAFTPDGRRLVSAERGDAVYVWDVAGGYSLHSFSFKETPPREEYPDPAYSILALSPDGRLVAMSYAYSETGSCCNVGHTVVVWNVETGARLLTIDEPPVDDAYAGINSFAWSPDSRTLAVSHSTGTPFTGVAFWDIAAGQRTGSVDGYFGHYRSRLFWSPDGKKIIAYQSAGNAVLDAVSYKALFEFDLDSDDEILDWSADSSRFAIHRWRAQSIEFIDSTTGEAQEPSSSIKGSSSSTTDFTRFFLITGKPLSGPQGANPGYGPYFSLVEWNALTKEVERTVATGTGSVDGVSWSPDGAYIAIGVGQANPQALIWDIEADKPVVSLDSGQVRYTWHAAWSPDGKLFANLSENLIDIYDTSTWQKLNSISMKTQTSDAIKSLSWSPDSRRIAVQIERQLLRVINVPDGGLVFEHDTADDYIIAAWSDDGTRIATVGEGGNVEFWDAETGERLKRIAIDPIDYPYSVSFSPDLSMLATVLTTRAPGVVNCEGMKVWSTDTGKVLSTYLGGTYFCDWRFLWNPWQPGSSLLAAFSDGGYGLFNAKTGELINSLPAGPDLFSPDGVHFATFDSGGVTIWEISP